MSIDKVAITLEKLSEFLERPIYESDLDKGYDALGADSMDMVVLAFEIEKEYGIEIMPELFLQHNTIREAIEAIPVP